MKAKIEHLQLEKNRRILAVSDIHAHKNYLERILQMANFNKQDVLFIVGDILERGLDSLGTLRYIMELSTNYTVHTLIGNIDLWQISMLESTSLDNAKFYQNFIQGMHKYHGSCFFTEMCREAGLPYRTEDDIWRAKSVILEKFCVELDFIRSLPTVIDTDNFTFVHGGLPTKELDTLDLSDAHPYLKNDAFIEKGIVFDKYLICGHWPATLYCEKIPYYTPYISTSQKIIDIDGGCGVKSDGQLNILIIPNVDSEEFSWLYCDDLPVFQALDDQDESDSSISITFADRKIRILKMGDEFSYVCHLSSGYCLWMPNSFINKPEEYTEICRDYTDYMPPIKSGEKLSLIAETSRGYIIKSKGVCGWYKGKIANFR